MSNENNSGFYELELKASKDNLSRVMGFVEEALETSACSIKAMMQINLAVEEIFVNVASYAYAPDTGNVTVRVGVGPGAAEITFIDSGVPYDPLAKPDPDVTLSAQDRAIGGLGIFITKKFMDEVSYEYKDGRNILTLKKCF